MGTNGGSAEKRARAADRDLAVDFIEEAWVDGQLSREEYDERVGRVLGAATLFEVEREVRDLQGPGGAVWAPTVPEVRPAPAPPAPAPPAPAPARAPVPEVWESEPGYRWARYAAGAVGALAVLLIGGNLMAQDDSWAPSPVPVDSVVVDPEHLASLVESEFGTTEVFSAWTVPDGITVVVPRDGSSRQAYESTWREDGTWSERKEIASKGKRLDLAEVEVDVDGVALTAWTSLIDTDEVITRVQLGTYEGTPTCLTTTALGDGEEITHHYDCDGQLVE